MTKKKFFVGIICLVFAAMIPVAAKAFSSKTGNAVYVSGSETVNGNFFAAGQTITVDGRVTGDVICAGQVININGVVEGDIIGGGQTININGQVNGSVRVAGSSININGKIARNAMLFGSNIYLGDESSVGWDVFMAGATGAIRGKIGRGLKGNAASMVISGEIKNDVFLQLDKSSKSTLIIGQGARIGGNLNYTAGKEAEIADKAIISGEVIYNVPEAKTFKKPASWMKFWIWGMIYSIFAAIVIGLVLVTLWKDRIKNLTDGMTNKVGRSIGWGAIIMFLTPVAVVLLFMTVIGIPLGLILIGIWIIALFISKVIAGIAIGQIVFAKIWPKKKFSLIWPMVAGIVVSWIIFSIPVIGWMLSLVAVWWGLGSLCIQCKKA